MRQLDLISNPRADRAKSPHHVRGFLASCVFHGSALCLIVVLAIFYHEEKVLPKSGSAPGSPSISLEKMTIVSPPPPEPPTLQPPKPTPAPAASAPTPTVTTVTPPPPPEAKPTPPVGTVPVLAIQPTKPLQTIPQKTSAPPHPTIPHPTATMAQVHPRPAAAAAVSSYTPGPSALPHPPYPTEARDLRETGIVVMNVQFDGKGDVAHAVVAQSSGVAILDSETRSFIRANWHSLAFAGQTVSVPVQYTLQNL